MSSEELLLCHQCGKTFYKLSTLESHTKWKHMEKSNEFMCEQCGKTFQKKFNLIKHLASDVHKISESVNCALCEFRSLTRKVMCSHYQDFHRIILNGNNAYFKTPEEFLSWKVQYENNTRSRFVKLSSSRKRKNGLLRSTYFCHRDGNFRSKGKNLRHLKIKGSNKINAHCPAKMEVEMGENLIIVSYIDTHLGHDRDVTRMSLDSVERAIIAEKLALKVPFEQILDEINNKKYDNDIQRINLLTRKDLWNIVETFKINPKAVVYNKTRMRRKKRSDKSKVFGKKNQVYLKVLDDHCSKTQTDKKSCSTEIKEEEFMDQQIVSAEDVNKDNLILCPIFLKNEHNEDIQHYVVVSNENVSSDGCLIINSDGELENVSGHQFVYSEDGGVPFPENALQISEDVGIQIYENGVIQTCYDNEIQICGEDDVQIFNNEDIKILDSDEVEVCISDGVQILEDIEIQNCEDEKPQISEVNTLEIYEDSEESCIYSMTSICENHKINNDTSSDLCCTKVKLEKSECCDVGKSKMTEKSSKVIDISKLQRKPAENVNTNAEISLNGGEEEHKVICVDNSNTTKNIYEVQVNTEQEEDSEMLIADHVYHYNDFSMIKIEEVSEDYMQECEVTIDSFEEEQADESIIPDIDNSYCNLNSSEGIAQQVTDLSAFHVSQEELLIGEEVSTDITNHVVLETEVPEVIANGRGECEVVDGGELKWNKKREEVLHKLLNVHSMINNEHQLKVFSNNIISIENVLKSMSESDDVTHDVNRPKTKKLRKIV